MWVIWKQLLIYCLGNNDNKSPYMSSAGKNFSQIFSLDSWLVEPVDEESADMKSHLFMNMSSCSTHID